ncbi:fasciclin-like arabinogalactan protein 3 [Momordica charantia]|uniref:Fasciclin-like arabinogalactan protein 3 n=1 Tax=Momordica charantia TaxID=3673 RepID=A0A6J1BR76_MOMCH|nr:fasciclin-like arabinogalactan protein 3 [Momordica charantia]
MMNMMNPRASSSVLCFTPFLILLLFSPSASAFNITRLLNQFPQFGAFNDYLTKTHLFEQINTRQTITVLALDNATVAAIAQNSLDVIKQILSAHVILDYYDNAKFKKLGTDKPTVLTTMFQATGDAVYQQGFVKVVHNRRGEIEFGSAAKSAPFTSRLVEPVASQPYNISVLQISSPIVVPGIGRYNLPPPSPEAPEPPVEAPAPASADAPAPEADAPDADSPSPAADAPSPAADAPSPAADAPDAPAKSPKKAADADDADAPGPADADAADDSAASRGQIAGAGVVLGLLSVALAF